MARTKSISLENELVLYDLLRKPGNILYQYITREDMESNLGIKITDAKWEKFVEEYSEPFWDEVSKLAKEYWLNK